MTLAATPSVRIEKTFPYRGGTKTFSNRYHFNGGTPADGAHWDTLFDAIVLEEKVIHNAEVTIVAAIGYAAGSEVPVRSKSYATAGTFSQGGNDHGCPGECCAVLRYATAARSTKNHPVYLFNYFHRVFYDNTAGAPDQLAPDQATAISEYATDWIGGFSDGTNTYVRAGPNGATATGSLVLTYISHRDFPK